MKNFILPILLIFVLAGCEKERCWVFRTKTTIRQLYDWD